MELSRLGFISRYFLVAFSLLALSACGGGGGGGGGDGGTQPPVTYTIGGTVSGLTGTLVLQNNSGNDITITSNGNFIFNTQITNLGTYDVSVNSQPTDQFCSISNGYGTVSGSNISNITVVCVPTFNLGGTVSGLSGTLVLYSSGGDTLTITSNGNFNFDTKIAESNRYSVSVSQPSNQFCRINNASSIMPGNDVDNVLVSCGANPLTLRGHYGSGIHNSTAIVGNIAYVATTIGLLIEDITDPANPVVLANHEIPVGARQITINGSYAYVGTDKLYVFNIQDPTAPYEVAQLDIQATSQTVLNGNYLYILDYSGLRVIDISNPASPTLGGTLSINNISSMKISGSYAYLTDNNNGLRIYSLSNPTAPVLVGSFNGDELRNPQTVAIRGQYAYVTDHSYGLKILDISNPASPVYAGSYEMSAEQFYGIEIRGDFAYVADLTNGIQVLNLSNPTSPTSAGTIDVTGWAASLRLDGNRAYVQGWSINDPVIILDISTPSTPTLVGEYYGSGGSIGYTQTLAINGNYAYLGGNDLNIIDITDPANPQPAAVYNPASLNVNDIVINNNLAYLAGYDLEIIDITTPLAPNLVGLSSSVSYGEGIAINGNYAYIAEWVDGLRIIDITTPSSPVQTAHIDTPGQAQNVTIRGNYAYIADYLGGLRIVDISQPATPTEVSVLSDYSTIYYPEKIVLNGDYAYVDGSSNVIDISDPTTPVVLNTNHTMTNFHEIVISNNLAFVAGYSGLSVFDISDPLMPVEIAALTTRATPKDVAVIGNTVYVAEYGYGLEIFEFTPP